MKWTGVAVVVLVGGVVAGGCAFGDRHVAVHYPPRVGPGGGGVAPARAAKPVAAGVTLVIKPFEDDRDRRPIGEVRNGFGMHTADVLAKGNIASWVTNAVSYELQAAGFDVRAFDDEALEPNEILISGQILNFYCRAMATYEAEVSINIQAGSGAQTVFAGHVRGEGGSGVNWAATSEGYGESLAIALQDAARRVVAQIRSGLRRASAAAPSPPPAAPAPASEPIVAPVVSPDS